VHEADRNVLFEGEGGSFARKEDEGWIGASEGL